MTTAVTNALPFGRPLVRADLDGLPDDGHRYELIDGTLLVSPAARADFTEKDLPVPPLLAVEVLSTSTRRVDLLLKRDRYQAAGIASYWIVDPDEPSVTVLELDEDGEYVETHRSVGDETIRVTRPFPVAFSAVQLLA